MKKLSLIILLVFSSTIAFPKANAKSDNKPILDAHTSIYTQKVKRIVNAINIGDFNTDSEYFAMLKIACDRNKCSALEKKTIKNVGQQIVHCKIKHLKSHGIENSDVTNICQSKQAIFGCDSLANPLLRKMCYTGNNYSLKALMKKERHMKSRIPASIKNK